MRLSDARIRKLNTSHSLPTVEQETGEQVAYDPRRFQSVVICREADRFFAIADRVQVTCRTRNTTRVVRSHFPADAYPHFDHGYVVTSYSCPGQTADRVLLQVHTVPTEKAFVKIEPAFSLKQVSQRWVSAGR
jgi:hypothetical protein